MAQPTIDARVAAILRHGDREGGFQTQGRILRLPRTARGFPIPRFVGTINGRPEFRVADQGYAVRCLTNQLCWVCGERLGRHMAFVVGIISTVSGTTGEPACHRGCAEFALQACPYLSNPAFQRTWGDDEDRLHGSRPLPGHIDHRSGVGCAWVASTFQVHQFGHGFIIRMGVPTSTTWWAHGRRATRRECLRALVGALPVLREHQKRQGLRMVDLVAATRRTMALMPARGATNAAS